MFAGECVCVVCLCCVELSGHFSGLPANGRYVCRHKTYNMWWFNHVSAQFFC